MKRKVTVLTLSAMLFALCGSVDGQQTGKVARIGYLDSGTASGSAVLLDAFRQELRKLGYIEGQNISTEYRYEGKVDWVPQLAAEQVRLKSCADWDSSSRYLLLRPISKASPPRTKMDFFVAGTV